MNTSYEHEMQFLELPPLVLVVVLGSLSASDVLKAGASCKGLHALSQHNGVWKRVSKRHLKVKPSLGISKPVRWGQYYAQRLALAREGAFKWQTNKTTGDVITKRYQHTGSAVAHMIYYIGGQELPEKRFNDIYSFNTETLEVKKLSPASGTPPRFARHSAVAIGKTVYLFGGFDGVSQHFHLAAYDTITNVWKVPEVVGDIPPSRTNHAAAAIGNKMYIFGGMYKDTTGAMNGEGCTRTIPASNDKLVFLNDLFSLDTTVTPARWTRIPHRGDVPAPRCGHRLVSMGSKLILFGGGCGEQWDMKYSDVHVFDPDTNTWLRPKLQGQAPVCTFTTAFSVGVFLFVFGGQSLNDNNLTNDLYVLDTVSMAWTKVYAQNTYPTPRDMASGNVVDCSMHMFGGYYGSAVDHFFTLQMDRILDGAPRSKLTMLPNA